MAYNFLEDDYTINFYESVKDQYNKPGGATEDSIPMQLGMFMGAPNLRGQTSTNAYYVEKSNTTLKN